MWQRSRFFAPIVLMLLAAAPGRAQQPVVVLVETNLPDAVVYADSLWLGPASRSPFLVPAHARALRLVPAGGDLWAIEPLVAPLAAAAGDTLALRLAFPHYYQVETVPFGATVFHETLDGRRDLGDTPLLYQTPQPLSGSLVVERQGYVTQQVAPGNDVWNRHVLTLQPVTPPQEAQTAEVAWHPPVKRHRWIDYTAAAVAVGAGALAVHYKFKADRLDDRYRESGDPALRDRITSLDTRSVIALGVMQAGVGVLAVRFILR